MVEKINGQKYLWKIKKIDEKLVQQIASQNNLNFAISRVLAARGFVKKEQIYSYLFTSFKDNVYDPCLFKDSNIAVERILSAIDKKEKILIFGDYDVDGITSTSILLIFLLSLNANVNFYLPNRDIDGYGLSEKIVKKAASNGYKLIITVDNGITAYKAAETAFELGVDLIITDHHRPHEQIPKAVAIVDSNQIDCKYPYKDLAGVGTIFKIISMIYEYKNLELPDKIYELLLLGTVADVVPLTGENRYWVRFGLNKINKNRSFAIETLMQNSRLNKTLLDSLDIAFMLVPQLNALGRLDDPREAVQFLISSDKNVVERIGYKLKKINEDRKKIDSRIYLDIETAILEKKINLEKENIIIAASSDWPPGVIGLVAGRLANNYGKPSFLFHLDKNGLLKGSCRSIPEFDIFDALNDCKDLLIQFGGHSFAAGLKLHKNKLHIFKETLEKRILEKLKPEDLIPKIEVDALLQLPELKMNFLSDLQKLEPFGNKNDQPIFLIRNLTLLNEPMLLKDKHVKCNIFDQGVIKPVIFFNRPELIKFFNNIKDASFDLTAYISKNEWNGKVNIELQGVDVAIENNN